MSTPPVSLSPAADKTVSVDRLQILSPYLLNPKNSDEQKIKDILDDVRTYVNRIDIFENMFSPALTGEVYFRDTQALTNLALMRGLDQLWLQFSMRDKENLDQRKFGPFPFAIYNQSNRSPVNKASEEFALGICSPELIASTVRKISRSYVNKKPEDIIKDIVEQPYGLSSKKTFVERQTTKRPIKLVVPYMRPLEVIQLLTLQGQSDTNETNYLFFETLEGYHYTSFGRLLQIAARNTKIPTIYLDLAGQREVGNTRTRIKAEQLQVISGFDILYAMSRGYFASTTIAPDVLSGVCGVEISGAGWDGAYDRRLRVNPNGRDIYPKELGLNTPPTARIFVVPTTAFSAANTQLTSKDSTITDNFIAQTLDGRNRELLGLQSRCIRGRVAGAPELHAGSFIDVEFPTPLNNKNTGTPFKDLASGRYIIINAKHSIVADGRRGFFYETTFEAVTDSFAAS
jgi:hypothetical protein